jgi:hypothetical protein
MSGKLIGPAEWARIKKWQDDMMSAIPPGLRATIEYMHDGTQECQEIVLSLCRRHGERECMIQRVLLYYLALTAQKVLGKPDTEESLEIRSTRFQLSGKWTD